MAAYNFPNSPSDGDTVTVNGVTYTYSSSKTRWDGAAASDVVDDTTPQLGGNLDVNGNTIVSASNGDIPIAPNGSGKIVLDSLNWPTADGSANQVLKTDGSGQLGFVNNITSVVAGNGLTGGATSGDATVTVGAGAGVTVNSADVAVTMPVQAFVQFVGGNAAGTLAVSVTNSANVSSVTDLGVGNYRVNFSSTLSSEPAVTVSANNVQANTNFGINVNAVNTNSVTILCIENGSAKDKDEISVIAVAD